MQPSSGTDVAMVVDEPFGGQKSRTVDAFGQWQWSAEDVRRMVEEAGFGDVAVAHAPTRMGLQLIRGVKQGSPPVAEVAETPALAHAART